MQTHRHLATRKLLVLLGLLYLPLFALAASFDVTVQDDDGSGGTSGTLSWAIQSANDAGIVAGGHTITLKTDVMLTGRMRRLIEQSVTVTADISRRVVGCAAGSGGQPFWIGGKLAGTSYNGITYPAANALVVILRGFSIAGCLAKGGTAAGPWLGASGRGGGGGAGMGGAIFIYHGRTSLERLSLSANSALGGASGSTNTTEGGGGGGLGGGTNDRIGGGLWVGNCGGVGYYSDCPGSFGGGILVMAPDTGFGKGGDGGFGGPGGGVPNGQSGGFGGGGGGAWYENSGGRGGFGGGGGGNGGVGGFGGGSATAWGGGGAGMGGAVFVRTGTLTLKSVTFAGNQASGGSNGGSGYGGALFICTADLDTSNGNGNTAAENCSASVDIANSCSISYVRNSATTSQPNYYWSGNMTALDALPACAPSGPVIQLLIDPDSASTLYSGLDGAGVYQSTDSGANWMAAATQPTDLNVKALAKKSGTPLYAGTAGGIYKAASGTTTFAACATQPKNQNIQSLTLDATGKLYAGTESGVYASSDQCANWSAMNTGLPE